MNWIKGKLNINIVSDKLIQLFGIPNLQMCDLNLIFLICRFYIYKTKMMESIPTFTLFKKDVNTHVSLERYIAIKNGNMKAFENKWGNCLVLCENYT